MTDFLLRPAVAADLDDAALLWQTAFHDPAPLVRRMLTEGGLLDHAVTAVADAHAASVMFAFPGLAAGGCRAAYLYALCTHPDHRGRGLGAAVLDAIARRSFDEGADLVLLSPADAGLSRWYQHLGFAPLGTVTDVSVAPAAHPQPGTCVPLDAGAYGALRRAPLAVPPGLLRAQFILLDAAGGGFFRLALPGGDALACAEPTPAGLLVTELLCPPPLRDAALETLARHFKTPAVRLRCPGGDSHQLLCRCRAGLDTVPPEFSAFPYLMG